MENLLESDVPFSLVPDTFSILRGSGWASGGELLLRRQNCWVGYSLAFTRRTFDGASFWPVFDTRHTINVAFNVPLGRNWDAGVQWVCHSGFPYTGPLGRYQYVVDPDQTDWQFYQWHYVYGERGGFRYPDYHRLDASVEKGFRWLGADWKVYLQVVNVYARKNVMYYNYGTDAYGRPTRDPVYMLPFPIPSLGISGSF